MNLIGMEGTLAESSHDNNIDISYSPTREVISSLTLSSASELEPQLSRRNQRMRDKLQLKGPISTLENYKPSGSTTNKSSSPCAGGTDDEPKLSRRNQRIRDKLQLKGPISTLDVKNNAEKKKRNAHAVRNKEDRKKLIGYECHCCRKFYDSLQMSPKTRAEYVNKVSRHRAEQIPPTTPEHYYSGEFPLPIPSSNERKNGGLPLQSDAGVKPKKLNFGGKTKPPVLVVSDDELSGEWFQKGV